jgi:hypothetical protein
MQTWYQQHPETKFLIAACGTTNLRLIPPCDRPRDLATHAETIMASTSATSSTDIFSILQSAYTPSTQISIPAGSKFANVDATKWQGTWTATDTKGKPITVKVSNVSGYRATVRYQSQSGGLQVGRVYINTNGVFRIGDSQMQLTGTGKMTISTIITDSTTGNQSVETDHATLQSS